MSAPRRNEVDVIRNRPGAVVPVTRETLIDFLKTETITVRVKGSMAARLARMTLDSGWSAERFILDLLDDALPAPSRENSTSRE